MTESLISLKYAGQKTADGAMDARLSAEALLGFDRILRHAIGSRDGRLKNADFELPVHVRQGSWEMVVGGSLVVGLMALAKKWANDGLLESGPAKDIQKLVRGAGIAIAWFIRIKNHAGQRKGDNVTFGNSGSVEEVEVINKNGQSLLVPRDIFEFYQKAPRDLLEQNAKIVADGRELILEVEGCDARASITAEDRAIYVRDEEEEEEDVILPELVHGKYVELEGRIVRTNESTKTIGFRHKDHTLTVRPEAGHLEQYKAQIVSTGEKHIFSNNAIVYGVVDRENLEGRFKKKRPEIVFSDIHSMEPPPAEGLFD